MTRPDPITYARGCARANPGKTNAIMCLRNLVEGDGVSVDAALSAVLAAFPLGLSEIDDITTKARARYAVAA
jgi:hypothetical protein